MRYVSEHIFFPNALCLEVIRIPTKGGQGASHLLQPSSPHLIHSLPVYTLSTYLSLL